MENKYFNIEVLTNLIGEDKNILSGMLENIVNSVTKRYSVLNTNYANQDWEQVRDDAHFLKSNFRYLGNMHMHSLLKTMELNAMDETKRAEIGNMLTEFNDTFPLILKEVEDYIHYLKN